MSGKPQGFPVMYLGETDGTKKCQFRDIHHAGEIVEKKLDAIEQLQKIKDYANELLDFLMRWNRGDKTAL